MVFKLYNERRYCEIILQSTHRHKTQCLWYICMCKPIQRVYRLKSLMVLWECLYTYIGTGITISEYFDPIPLIQWGRCCSGDGSSGSRLL